MGIAVVAITIGTVVALIIGADIWLGHHIADPRPPALRHLYHPPPGPPPPPPKRD